MKSQVNNKLRGIFFLKLTLKEAINIFEIVFFLILNTSINHAVNISK